VRYASNLPAYETGALLWLRRLHRLSLLREIGTTTGDSPDMSTAVGFVSWGGEVYKYLIPGTNGSEELCKRLDRQAAPETASGRAGSLAASLTFLWFALTSQTFNLKSGTMSRQASLYSTKARSYKRSPS
jgi:hypothetical protein